MKFTFKHTMLACYASYITSAIINNLAALLFVTFNKNYSLTLEQLAFIVTVNFGVQIFVDLLGAKYADVIGYRKIMMCAHLFSALGLTALGVLPTILDNAFSGILIAVSLCAIGSGLIEVVISPIVEAIPGDAKAFSMSLLHSFYCWGHVLVVIASTTFLWIFGRESWSILCCLWAIIPVVTFLFSIKVPINQLSYNNKDNSVGLKQVFGKKILWLFMLLMLCSAAAEQSMAQWASFFAETELGFSKQISDILGPCIFAFSMGIARILFAFIGDRVDIKIVLFVCSVLCIVSFCLCAFSPYPALCFTGCALCGFSVSIMWPGVLSLAARTYPVGGTAMFAILALFGDLGCSLGPEAVAVTGSLLSDGGSPVKTGLAYSIVFPVLNVITIIALFTLSNKRKQRV